MKALVEGIFKGVTLLFDSVPFLNRFKGYRSVLGFVGLAVVAILRATSEIDPDTLVYLDTGFLAFTGISLLAHENK
jgi:hypothetical protein